MHYMPAMWISKKMLLRFSQYLYLLVLGITSGGIIMAGAIVAPTIFYPNNIIGSGHLDRFLSGLLMTSIFNKFNYVLLICLTFIILYELKLRINGIVEYTKLILAILSAILISAFSFYFIPQIINLQSMQSLTITDQAAFNNLHQYSELCFKLLLITLLGLFFFNIPKTK